MLASRLDLVEVNVSDWAAAVEWYRTAFDLDVAYEDEEHRWCELAFVRGGPRFALRELADVQHGTPAPFTLSLEVESVDAALDQLRGRGVEVRSEVKEAQRPTGQRYRWANIADPEGNTLRVFEWLPSN